MSREAVAVQQASLLRALLADGPTPAGFDADRIQVQARALVAKRGRVIRNLRPDLADELGDRFGPLFAEYALGHPKRDDTRARQDADNFGAWLVSNNHLVAPRRSWWRPRR